MGSVEPRPMGGRRRPGRNRPWGRRCALHLGGRRRLTGIVPMTIGPMSAFPESDDDDEAMATRAPSGLFEQAMRPRSGVFSSVSCLALCAHKRLSQANGVGHGIHVPPSPANLRKSANIGRVPAASNSAGCGRSRASFGPILPDAGQVLARIGQNRAKVGRTCTKQVGRATPAATSLSVCKSLSSPLTSRAPMYGACPQVMHDAVPRQNISARPLR